MWLETFDRGLLCVDQHQIRMLLLAVGVRQIQVQCPKTTPSRVQVRLNCTHVDRPWKDGHAAILVNIEPQVPQTTAVGTKQMARIVADCPQNAQLVQLPGEFGQRVPTVLLLWPSSAWVLNGPSNGSGTLDGIPTN